MNAQSTLAALSQVGRDRFLAKQSEAIQAQASQQQFAGQVVGYSQGQATVKLLDGSIRFCQSQTTGAVGRGAIVSVYQPATGPAFLDAMPY